ncbi:MAG: hypothetical protein ACE5GX_10695 [Thermoanaerobaculia bacterium]
MSETFMRRLRAAFLPSLMALAAAALAAPGATALGSSTGTLRVEVVEFQDAQGNPIGTLPPGFTLQPALPGVSGIPNAGNSGNGTVVFGGSAAATGSAETAVIDLVTDSRTSSGAGTAG